MPYGHARGTSHIYANGLESMEIWVNKSAALPLPFKDNTRVQISIEVGGECYSAGIRATTRNSYVWICPDLKDGKGKRVSLAQVFEKNGIDKNQKINLEVNGTKVSVQPLARAGQTDKQGQKTMKAHVIVTLKQEVSDPQGFAVSEALNSMKYNVKSVRVGKFFEVKLDGLSREQAEAQLHEMTEKLLSNPVVEDYRFEIVED